MSSSPPGRPPRLTCRNCGASLSGPYCAQCGQHDVDYHQSFGHLTEDLLENLFHFEGKFFVSVAWLLAQPGRLTNEFNAGRRQSQLHPLRFYIFVSVMFFLGVTLLNHGHLFPYDAKKTDEEIRMGVERTLKADAEAKAQGGTRLTEEKKQDRARRIQNGTKGWVDGREVAEAIDQAQAAKEKKAAEKPDGAIPLKVTKVRIDQNSDLGQRFMKRVTSGEFTFSKFAEALEHRAPTLLFLGVPVFALLLKLLYFRSRRYYIEHLIFSLHLHTWVFLAWMVSHGWLQLAALGPAWITSVLGYAVSFWLVWYFLASFRAVYHQGWIKTGVKTGLLVFTYLMSLTLMFGVFAAGTFYWLAME